MQNMALSTATSQRSSQAFQSSASLRIPRVFVGRLTYSQEERKEVTTRTEARWVEENHFFAKAICLLVIRECINIV